MRVSTQNMYTSNLYSLQNTTSDLASLNEKMATSKSILRPSDDPIGSVKIIGCQRDMAATNQYLKNIDSLSTSFNRAETNLSSMVELHSRMNEITVTANNASLSPADRAAYAAELNELVNALKDTVNAKDEAGNYLFSGNQTDTPPVSIDAKGNFVYQGDAGHREVQISSSSWVPANVTAEEYLFSNSSTDILNQTKDFIAALEDPSLAPGNPAFDTVAKDMLTTLEDTLTSIGNAMTDIGGKQNSLSLVRGSHEEMVLFNKEVIGETEGLDYAQATAEFNIKLTTLKVTQKTFVQVSQLTLFSQL